MTQKLISGPIKGYKITDKDMKCRDVVFKLGQIVELGNSNDLQTCKNGFHFCEQPSGVWSYYSEGRLFECEAYDVLDVPFEAGTDFKRVCRKIKLTSEIKIGGDRNTGYMNTGDSNTGDGNTGHRNTGDRNTGYMNTGHRNTGDRNTGYMNTGYSNTGDGNTGHRNTGDRNTGYMNTGDSNTGDGNTGHRNTGYSNTGDGNTGDRNTGYMNTGDGNTGDGNTGHMNTGDGNTGDRNTGYMNTGDGNTGVGCVGEKMTGYFCSKIQPVLMFDSPTKKKIDEELVYKLSRLLESDKPFDAKPFLSLPNATEKKIKDLHKRHIEGRKQVKEKQ